MQWNSQLEQVISKEGEKCLSYSWLHNRAEKKYNALDVWVNVPVIVLSTLAGSASIGSDSLFNGWEFASVIIGIISILVGIINTLGSYFAWGKRSEGHRICSISYNKAYNFVKIELALPRPQRTPPDEFLKLIKNELERLKEISPAIPDDIIAEYKNSFSEYKEVSKPEICNGLDNIHIYSEMEEQQIESKRASLNLSHFALPLPPPPTPIEEPPVSKIPVKKVPFR
jgi:hypothetical protein